MNVLCMFVSLWGVVFLFFVFLLVVVIVFNLSFVELG